jgi:hypothetical protein
VPDKIFSITVTGVKELVAKYPLAVRTGAELGIEKAILLLENAVKTKIQQGRPPHGATVATGTLYGAVFSEMHGSPVAPYGVVAVSPPADRYALVVEKGRTPGARMPPPEALITWVRQKLGQAITAVATVTGKSGKPQRAKAKAADADRSLAFVVARSIGRKGFPGVHMFENAFNEQQQNVQQIIQEEIRGAIAAIGR